MGLVKLTFQNKMIDSICVLLAEGNVYSQLTRILSWKCDGNMICNSREGNRTWKSCLIQVGDCPKCQNQYAEESCILGFLTVLDLHFGMQLLNEEYC